MHHSHCNHLSFFDDSQINCHIVSIILNHRHRKVWMYVLENACLVVPHYIDPALQFVIPPLKKIMAFKKMRVLIICKK